MNENKVVKPSKDEVIKILEFALDSKIIGMDTIGDLLGLKWIDSFLPKVECEPEWNYDGLKLFFEERKIKQQETIQEALIKLK